MRFHSCGIPLLHPVQADRTLVPWRGGEPGPRAFSGAMEHFKFVSPAWHSSLSQDFQQAGLVLCCMLPGPTGDRLGAFYMDIIFTESKCVRHHQVHRCTCMCTCTRTYSCTHTCPYCRTEQCTIRNIFAGGQSELSLGPTFTSYEASGGLFNTLNPPPPPPRLPHS